MLSPTASLLSITLLFTSLSSAITWDCSHVRADGVKFNFEKLKGPHSVSVIDEDRPPSVYNTTWTVDICAALVRRDDINKTDQCPQGTFVCGIVSSYKKEDDSDKHEGFKVVEAIPIAGNFHTSDGKGLEPQYERLKKKDAKTEGLELELNGGTFDKRKQKAIIQLQCDKDRTGNEGKAESSSLARRADEKDDQNSLSYVSYGVEEGKEGMEILRLNWKTQYACEDAAEEGSTKSGWGFFTWLIVLLFLGIAAYLIFGSWLNYNRYGARGWDLLPHGDTIRDVPYLFKDWSRRVVSTVSGGGSRGGYSAV